MDGGTDWTTILTVGGALVGAAIGALVGVAAAEILAARRRRLEARAAAMTLIDRIVAVTGAINRRLREPAPMSTDHFFTGEKELITAILEDLVVHNYTGDLENRMEIDEIHSLNSGLFTAQALWVAYQEGPSHSNIVAVYEALQEPQDILDYVRELADWSLWIWHPRHWWDLRSEHAAFKRRLADDNAAFAANATAESAGGAAAD